MGQKWNRFRSLTLTEGKNEQEEKNGLTEIDMERILPNPFQPRQYFDEDHLRQLAVSIADHGLLQPIVVRKVGQNYELISGERRFRAGHMAGLVKIPAIVREMTDKQSAEMALIENLQREDLNYFEEAQGYQRLLQEFGLTQEQLAQRMGKSQPTIANKLRLLGLSENLQKEIQAAQMTERHARSLLRLKSEELQWIALEKIRRDDLNVRQTEQYIENLLIAEEKNHTAKRQKRITKAIKDMRIFLNTIDTAVEAIREAGLAAEISEKEYERYVEVVIHLPKNAAVCRKNA